MVWTKGIPSQKINSIAKTDPSLTEYSQAAKTPEECFKLLITPEIVQKILKFTNKHASDTKDVTWKPLSEAELWAFIAVVITIGYERRRKVAVDRLFTSDALHKQAIFSTIMSRDRYYAIVRNIRFDDKTTRPERIKQTGDRAEAVREIFDSCNDNFSKAYNPSETITIDERMVPFSGNCGMLVFMKNKPGAKTGMKLWVAADAKTSYATYIQLYFPGKIRFCTL